MGYAKERGKLEKLITRIAGLERYDEKTFANLNDSHDKYSHTIRILKNKDPETFTEFYLTELQEIKQGKIAVKGSETDEARQKNFIAYKETILRALEKTIKTTHESL